MREYISARYLLAPPPPAETVIPPNVKITRCAARVALGARKTRLAPRGDAPTLSHAARSTSQVYAYGYDREKRNRAARG